MPCFVALLALLSPRLALIAIWLFSNLLDRAYDGFLVPLLGFFLLPWTTLFYAVMWDTGTNGVNGIEWAFVILGFVLDLGSLHRRPPQPAAQERAGLRELSDGPGRLVHQAADGVGRRVTQVQASRLVGEGRQHPRGELGVGRLDPRPHRAGQLADDRVAALVDLAVQGGRSALGGHEHQPPGVRGRR